MCARIAVRAASRSPASYASTIAAVLGRQVGAALELAAADHLHHQVDRRARGRSARAESCRRDRPGARGRRRSQQSHSAWETASAVDSCSSRKRRSPSRPTRADGALGGLQLERQPHVVARLRSPTRSAASRSSRAGTSTLSSPSETSRVSAWWTGLRETPSVAASSCRLTFSPGPSSRRTSCAFSVS